MRFRLPPPLDRDLHPVEEEVAEAAQMTQRERLAVLAAVCRDSIALLNLAPDRDDIPAARDEVPASTRVALLRLHAAMRLDASP